MKRPSKKWRIGCLGWLGLFVLWGVISRFAPNNNNSTLPTTSRQIQAIPLSTNTPLAVATLPPVDTPLPEATTAPILAPTSIPLATEEAITLVALNDANLRSGPGTDFAISGHVLVGQPLNIMGHNADSTWYQLADQSWIAAFLAGSADSITPTAQPVVEAATEVPAAQPVADVPTEIPAAQPVYAPPPTSPPSSSGGSTCKDGTHSNSTGRGACSHHGGVLH